MSYIALYRKWRPLVFEDVVEQQHVVKTLKNSIVKDRIAHAYLFCGTRGTGKTTMAKIFARAINCLNPNDGDPCNECEICREILSGSILDVIEIDAASNNSVDNIREIRDEVIYAPSRSKYKVYIIDEVHMLSTGAFNALLKTLEEPPAHVVFILATTEPHKLPATILSRCQRFDFRRITTDSMVGRLERISQESGVNLKKDAARRIAGMADGALRDAISILDQCISLGKKEIEYNDVLSVTGIANETFVSGLVDALVIKDVNKILGLIDRLNSEGKDIPHFVSDFVIYFRNLLICSMTGNPEEILEVSEEMLKLMKNQCSGFSKEEIMGIIKELSSLEAALKWSAHPRVLLEVSLLKLCEGYYVDENDLKQRLSALEKKVENGIPVSKQIPSPVREPVTEPVRAAAAKTSEVKTPAATHSGKQKANVESIAVWDDMLKFFKENGKMVLYTNLMGTRAVELGDRKIGIVLDENAGFRKLIVSKPENIEFLEAEFRKRLGREVKVKVMEEEDLDNQPVKNSQETDEFLNKAKDLASKLNVPLNIIDE
ncbi:MAG: DNA polymerase III subunit gamma/tau [Bacillota bacterium]|nr:DNA polymerase III subunit gamma/tau [Bacillota bacterium]